MKRAAPLLALLALGAACDGGTSGPPTTQGLIAVGLARVDRSPDQQLSGFLAFFYDPDRQLLLIAQVQVNDIPLDVTVTPGIVPGPIYISGAPVQAGQRYRMTATVQSSGGPIQITSQQVAVPAVFDLNAPAQHPRGQPLTITWNPVSNVQAFNIVITGTTYEAEAPGSATSFTIPASALVNLESAEIEVTAYNGFYVSLSTGISNLSDAEQAARRFTQAENLTGARGSFGAATTAGAIVNFQ